MRIAITGTIGSGKSEVSRYLSNLGYRVFDCDLENKKLLKKGSKAYDKIKKQFPDCFDNRGINKKKIAKVVFNNLDKKKILENICHPLLLEELNKRKDNPLFCEVPLLFEVKWDKYFDHNLLVVSDEKILKERLINRGLDIEDINRRLNNQMSVKEKINRAEKIIYNNGSLKDLHKKIDNWLKDIC